MCISGNTILITGGATVEVMEKNDFEAAVGQAQFLRRCLLCDPEKVFRMINGGEDSHLYCCLFLISVINPYKAIRLPSQERQKSARSLRDRDVVARQPPGRQSSFERRAPWMD